MTVSDFSASASMPGASTRRGKVIQYNANEGKGVVSVDGAQHTFTISQWSGAEAPQLNRIVDVGLSGAGVSSVTPVSESVLLNEKAGELKAKLGGVLGSQIGVEGGSVGQNLMAFLGKPVLIGYAVFFLATILFNFVSVDLFTKQSVTLFKGTGLADLATGGNYRLGLYAAYLSIVVPVVWRNSKAWLATAIPLLVLLIFAWSMYSHYSDAMDQANRASNAFSGMFGEGGRNTLGGMMQAQAQEQSNAFSKMVSFGLGAYLSIAAAVYLAFLGIKKYLARS